MFKKQKLWVGPEPRTRGQVVGTRLEEQVETRAKKCRLRLEI